MSPAATTKKTPRDESSNKSSKKFPVARLEELTSPERSKIIDPQTIFGLLPLRVYQHIADIGCGRRVTSRSVCGGLINEYRPAA